VIAWLNLYGPLVTLRNNGDLAQDPRCQDTDNVSVTIALADGAVKSILLPIIYFNVVSTKPPSTILKHIASIPRLKSRFALPDDVGKNSINQLKGALKDAAKQVKERSAKSGRYSSHHSSTRGLCLNCS
jgi:hypothetical protein